MVNPLRTAFLQITKAGYQTLRPLIFRQTPQKAHELVIQQLSMWDKNPLAQKAFRLVNQIAFESQPVTVGGVNLPHPFILAAGFIKGHGFHDEKEALGAIRQGDNIIPGWLTMPNLVNVVEFGSFTRHPRMGNNGTIMWRDVPTKSTQNRVGLKNPGAVAAAAFLYQNINQLPEIFGINIAPSPGIDDAEQEKVDVLESINAFLTRGVIPSWFTLNLSCPNTEDDPNNNQTENKTRHLCNAIIERIGEIPLWVKISPDLSDTQIDVLMQVFEETGVRAVIATNTIGQPTPENATIQAGVGGGKLHQHAVRTAKRCLQAKNSVDVIACGGIQDPMSFDAFGDVKAAQYWSGLIYRGPLVAALILNERI